jgi:hypothetical protein
MAVLTGSGNQINSYRFTAETYFKLGGNCE